MSRSTGTRRAPRVASRSATGGGRPAETFDVVIVGGGSAGCVLAARLSENPATSVLLLEAGPRDRHPYIAVPAAFPKLFDGRLDWADRTAPQAALGGRRVFYPRGRVLGGSSSINAMMWIRGMAADYDAWGDAAGPDWCWQSIEPYFRRVEDSEDALRARAPGRLGQGGPLSISLPRDLNPLSAAWLAAARALGMGDLVQNAEDGEGVAPAALTQRRGQRHSAAAAYLRPVTGRPNLCVRTGALAERVLIERGRACAVAYVRRGRQHLARARAEVLVCAGAVGSPTLLWRSGIGPANELSRLGIPVVHHSPAVGSGLQDHLTSGLVCECLQPLTLAGAQSPGSLWRYLVARRGLLSSNVAEAYGYLRSEAGQALPDLEVLFAPVAFLDEGLSIPRVHGVTLGAVLLQPESRGRVSLRSSDPADPPIIDPAYLSDPAGADHAALAAGVSWCARVARTDPLAGLLGAPMAPQSPSNEEDLVLRAVRDHSQTLYHPVGTCAMSRASSGVLDAQLRVRGLERLRVADASAIPRIVRGHTNAATLALAERAADLVRAALG